MSAKGLKGTPPEDERCERWECDYCFYDPEWATRKYAPPPKLSDDEVMFGDSADIEIKYTGAHNGN